MPAPSARPGHGQTAIPIAVMPFDSLSSDSDDAYLADGLSCELISALSRAGRLMVTPRSDSFALRQTALTVTELGARLHVGYVVTGNVRRSADRVRVIAEFCETASGRVLWTKTYERTVADILVVQEDIASHVAAALGGEAYRAEVLNHPHDTGNMDAWSLTQRARHEYMVGRGPAANQAALELVRKATELDPDYALAQALYAALLMDGVSTASAADPDAACQAARAAIEQALARGADQPDVLMYAGRVWVELGERVKSIQVLRRGTQLSPHDLMEWGFLARSLAFGSQAEAEEAITIAERNLGISPDHPCAWLWQLFKGIACMNLERYAEARTLLEHVVTASPDFARGWMCFGSACGAAGDADGARAAAARATAINPALTATRFAGYVGVMAGNPGTTARITRGLAEAQLLTA
jgi:adenylate cyclase